MATLRFTDDDRDSRGFIRLSPPSEEPARAVEPPAPSLPVRRPAPASAVRVPLPRGLIVLISGGLIGLLLIALTIQFGAVPSRIAPQATAAPTATTEPRGDGIPTPSPIPATFPPVEVVYGHWAPDTTSGDIEIDPAKIVRVVDVRGPWARVEMDGGGLVWTGTEAIPPALLAAYTPPTATAVPYVRPTDPPPPPCAEAGIPGKMVQVCGWDDLSVLEAQAKAQWLTQYGGNAGIVLTPSPQVREP